ncbi:hypothetical protein CEUSTIGMA_g6348.t1 [Chlamydomonas eustigma]|uniref:Calcineurin-like phosphoesterase domain-containing protein n=1 Tax=Chlamydomonas eustigma TaxID=1157962 RepID=A0A250X7L7_9CHLO|nr:hypothetical protein CEUSTIGMA_g6348.t1 [Chlamydomonas eustigma]|eukprot:GAX78909.1 hypothetical protein CEUSTIGMA_g6348.t1 [Chlamydomonas eustigma]
MTSAGPLFVVVVLLSVQHFTCTVHSKARFCALGDFGADALGGLGLSQEGTTAAIVKALDKQDRLDGILALGDTNYPVGSEATIDQNVGKYYGQYVWPSKSKLSSGAPDQINRFFPCPGNHDWGNRNPGSLDAYLAYMPVSGRTNYDVVVKDVHIFSLDSDPNANRFNGTSSKSAQALWLKAGLAASTSTWKLVIFHHPPFSSSLHGSTLYMQWPFAEWGATAVLSGHDHAYERFVKHGTGFPYFVNGLGGAYMYPFTKEPLEGSQARFSGRSSVQLIEADSTRMVFKLLAATHQLPAAQVQTQGQKVLDVLPNVATEEMDCYEVVKSASGGNLYGPCHETLTGQGSTVNSVAVGSSQLSVEKDVSKQGKGLQLSFAAKKRKYVTKHREY